MKIIKDIRGKRKRLVNVKLMFFIGGNFIYKCTWKCYFYTFSAFSEYVLFHFYSGEVNSKH